MSKRFFHVPVLDADRPVDGTPASKRFQVLLAVALLPLALVLILPFVLLAVCWLYGSALVNGIAALRFLWRAPDNSAPPPLAKPHFLDNPASTPSPASEDRAHDA
jgi:hypothetical protein